MYCEDELLPISALQHLLFCRRRVALVHIEGVWANNEYTAEGNIVHERVDMLGFETRGDIRYATGLRIRSLRLGLIGRADLVEFRRVPGDMQGGVAIDGCTGLWIPSPVEYKRGEVREEEKEYQVQLCAQTLCLEEMLGVRIDSGFIYFAGARRRVEVAFDDLLRSETESAVSQLHALLESGITPVEKYSKKCKFCSLVDICMPKLPGNKSARVYLDEMFSDIDGG